MAKDKDLKTPNVPPLRFPGFTDEWKQYTIDDIAKIEKGSGISKDQLSEDGEECILYGELYTKYKSEIINEIYSKTNINSSKLTRSQKNDVIIPCSGESAEDIATSRCVSKDGILLGGDLNIIRFKDQDGAFMSYQLNGKRKYDIARVAQGVSVAHLYPDHLKSVKVNVPQIEEQRKIVRLLSLIDERIATQNKIIEDLKKLKSAIMVITFGKSNVTKNQWREVRLGNICERVTRRNSNNISNLILTIAAQYGLVSQIDFFNKSVASYYLLDKGDFAYNKSYSGEYTWGAVKRLDLYPQGVLSPLYICFRPIEGIIDSDFLVYLFESKCWYREVSEICVEGARNHGLLNVSVVDFFNMKLHLPDLSEQKRIAEMMNAISDKIEHSSQLYALYNNQKTYLLSHMFI